MSLFRWRDYAPNGEACHISQADQRAASGVVRHHHDYFEIFRVASGTGWHWCAEREHPLRAGHIVFVRPNDKHGFRTGMSSEPFVFINVAFSASSWAQLRQRYGWHQRPFFSEHPPDPPVAALDPETDRAAARLFAEMLSQPRTQATLDWFLLSVARLTEAPVGLVSPAAAPPWLHHALALFCRLTHRSIRVRHSWRAWLDAAKHTCAGPSALTLGNRPPNGFSASVCAAPPHSLKPPPTQSPKSP